ncbi:hypothetical protein BEH94_07975 [Candidatus Altiarchaeales archaeon WOR_SM1_SCG]|nr:hypothetical protein BEH94_07975 [Candidatus Altiarchaeales archaeon WOR_SM1_SCG]
MENKNKLKLNSVKSFICAVMVLGLIFGLSGSVSACCDTGGGTCYTCGQTITQSCTLNASLTSNGTCFTIGADNIVIDGNGHSITGNSTGDGIETEDDKDGVTIKNFKIYNFSTGIYLGGCGSDDNQIINNEVSLNLDGIIITDVECGSDNNTIKGNNVTNNTNTGVYFDFGAYNNNLTENLICWNGLDVNDDNAANSGDNNACNTTYNWNDTGTTGCTYQCIVCVDNDSDGYNITGGVCGPIDCDDNNVSIFPGSVHGCKFCNGTTGNLENVADGTSCEDGLWCNGAETCQAGVCTAGTPPTCDDGAYCNGVETCNEATDSCNVGTPPTCNDGAYCNGVETCNEETDSCNAGTPPTCDDGAYCNGVETCNETTDSCNAGTPPTCDDGAYCNGVETCNETTDSCDAGTPPTCDDEAYCNGVETCNETTDSCNAGTLINCSANNIPGIATCTYDPDNNPFTWDYFPGFTSVCDEDNDVCTTGTINLTHTDNCTLCGCPSGQCCNAITEQCCIPYTSSISGVSGRLPKPIFFEGCGDGLCVPTENYENCPSDCKKPIVCGDGTCEGDETYETCPSDCEKPIVCGDGTCKGDETYETCPSDCEKPIVCGDGTCEGDENCKNCEKDCRACPPKIVCGDGKCEGNETCKTCEADCGACKIPELIINCTKNVGVGETITCTVADEFGNPVPGAAVTLSDGRTGTIGDDGRVQFLAEQSGKIDAAAGKKGYAESERVYISVSEGTPWMWYLLILILILILLILLLIKKRKKE